MNRVSAPLNARAFSAAHTMRIDVATALVVRSLEAAGIETILLRGPAIARWLYDPPSERGYSDIDLLVHPDCLDAALTTLAPLGYRDQFVSEVERGAFSHARNLQYVETSSSRAHAGVLREVPIDLHLTVRGFGAPPATAWQALAAHLDELPLAGHTVTVLDQAALALIVALHVAQHGPQLDHPVEDLERALTRAGDQLWAETATLADELGASARLVAGLEFVPAGRALVARVGLSAAPDVETSMRTAGMPPVVEGIDRLAGTRGFRAKAVLLWRELFPTAAFMRQWSATARRGGAGLALAYCARPFWLFGRLPGAYLAWRRARRQLGA